MQIVLVLLLLSTNAMAQYRYTIDSSIVAAPEVVYDEYFGQTVKDPFRYLENLEDTSVQTWFKAQNQHCQRTLEHISNRNSVVSKMKSLTKGEEITTSLPKLAGGRLFYVKEMKQDDKELLYYRDSIAEKEVLLFDTKKYSKEVNASSAKIDYIEPSPSGDYLVFGVSTDGSEMATIYVLQIDDGSLLPERIERAMYGNPAWLPNESGFFYNQMISMAKDAPVSAKLHNSKVLFHTLNTPVEQDIEIFSRKLNSSLPIEPIDFPFPLIFPSSDDLFIYVYRGVHDDLTVYHAHLSEVLEEREADKIEWKTLFTMKDQIVDFAVFNNELYLLSHKNAPTFKLIRTSVSDISVEDAEVVIDAGTDILEDLFLADKYLYMKSTQNGISHLDWIDVESHKSKAVTMPVEGSIYLSESFFSLESKIFFKTDSWVQPPEIYSYNASSEALSRTTIQPKQRFELLDQLIVEELEVTSHDGVRVPLSLVYHKDTKKSGENLTILQGYGAYGFSFNPMFRSQWLPWFDYGGVLAIAHVRGGGEKGEEWHQAGLKETKSNSWKDFIACAEYLIRNNYTSKEHLAAYSASAGGITIGRTITERPDLFEAVALRVGAMNPLRHEFTQNTANVPEYGTIRDSLEFQYLYSMDPYQQVVDNTQYPSMFFTAGMNDTRLPPWLPGKMVARLQQATSSNKPILFRVDYDSGHFGGSLSQQDQEWADIFTFLLWQLGHPDFVLENL